MASFAETKLTLTTNMQTASPRSQGYERTRCLRSLAAVPKQWVSYRSSVAKHVGYRDISVVGNANDVDFAIRLALEHRGREFYFLNRYTSQYRLSNQSIRSQGDTCRKIYNMLEQLPLTSDAELAARDWLLEKDR